jgi:hypothetical protein
MGSNDDEKQHKKDRVEECTMPNRFKNTLCNNRHESKA